MRFYLWTTVLFCSVLTVSGCGPLNGPTPEEVAQYEDLATIEPKVATPGQVYRMGDTGICGIVKDDHIQVTYVIPGSVADGKIRKGDRVRGMQHRGMGGWGGIPNLVAKRIARIGRDWDWHFYVTVERDSLRGGKGNTVTFDLHMPPDPGNLCHYGPTGFFAKRYADHLVVDVVQEGSPADGKLQPGDRIVAVDGQPITLEAYQLFTNAIDKAESEAGGGELPLTVRRADAAETDPPVTVTLQLPVLGSYSKTAPINCPKTDKLITKTADWLVQDTKLQTTLHADLLGLLATGEEKYIKAVGEQVHEWAKPFHEPGAKLEGGGLVSWGWGYQNIVMTEYYLLTKDKYVLPAITVYSRTLADGQDAAGLWGHRMHHPEVGRAYGYGVMNQPSVTIFISLILATKCGVDDKVVLDAIERTHNHYAKWIGQGALPYGNHGPKETEFTNNGTSGSLAVAFALLGDKDGAAFYAAMSAAASDEILTGHSGPWWNILWSGLGANVAGPEMSRIYQQKIHWLHTVTRCWNGRHVDLLGRGSSPKSGRLSDTGSHLLNLCVGRRAIHITGKGMDKALWVSAEVAKRIVNAADIDTSSEDALLELLGHALPPVRLRAAQALAARDADVRDEVMTLLATGTVHQRIGAIHAIRNLKIEDAEDELLAMAQDNTEALWVRQQAVQALGEMDAAKRYTPELLKLLLKDKPLDPYQELDLAIGTALVKLYAPDPYATDLDKNLFYAGVQKLLDHKHAWGRGNGMALLKNIPEEDLPRVLDKLVYLIEDKDRTYTSYTGAGRQEALEILYRHGIKESMDYAVNTIKEPTGRGGPRARARKKLLSTFGAEARYLIPRIKEVLGKGGDDIIKQIEEATTTRDMTTLEEYRKEHLNKP